MRTERYGSAPSIQSAMRPILPWAVFVSASSATTTRQLSMPTGQSALQLTLRGAGDGTGHGWPHQRVEFAGPAATRAGTDLPSEVLRGFLRPVLAAGAHRQVRGRPSQIRFARIAIR